MRINPDEDYLDPQTDAYISADNVQEGTDNVNALDDGIHVKVADEKADESALV